MICKTNNKTRTFVDIPNHWIRSRKLGHIVKIHAFTISNITAFHFLWLPQVTSVVIYGISQVLHEIVVSFFNLQISITIIRTFCPTDLTSIKWLNVLLFKRWLHHVYPVAFFAYVQRVCVTKCNNKVLYSKIVRFTTKMSTTHTAKYFYHKPQNKVLKIYKFVFVVS